jgi:hypothetical protein
MAGGASRFGDGGEAPAARRRNERITDRGRRRRPSMTIAKR